MDSKERNWSGNYTYRAKQIVYPRNIQELQAIIASSSHLGVLGTRHTFNDIADSDETLISLRDFEAKIELNTEEHEVTVTANVTYGQLARYLDERGFALQNMASLPHISVVGACLTATHGSGEKNGNLATAVIGIEFIAADGTIHHVSRAKQADEFDGFVVGLGAYGVITRMSLHVVPRYEMRQNVYLDLPIEQAIAHFDEIQASAYSVSLFTDWSNNRFYQLWLKSIVGNEPDTATLLPKLDVSEATIAVHPLQGSPAEYCTEQLGKVGSWHERLPHFRLEFTPSHGEEIQTEYFIERKHIAEAIHLLNELGSVISPFLYTSEVRTVAADKLWLSPCYQRESVGIHFTWKPFQSEIEALTPIIEAKLQHLSLRPHWGKFFTLAPDYLRNQYERLQDFQKLVHVYDPEGKFSNDYLRRNIL